MPRPTDTPCSTLRGTGLFSAAASSCRVTPGGCGLRFTREGAVIPAHVSRVSTDTSWSGLPPGFPIRNTTLSDGASPPHLAATVEHVLSALAGLGVWDAEIELTSPECPILDGSAMGFVEILLRAQFTSTPPRPLTLTRRVEVRDERGGASITAEPLAPGEPPAYAYELDYGPGSPLPAHTAVWDLSPAAYAREVAPARTFSLLHEVEAARRAGLFAHLTPRDMLVIDKGGSPIDNQWRFPDSRCISTEPARHKLLDLIGDLALLGRPLHARVAARRSGHALTHQFCRAVLAAETPSADRA